MEIFYTKIEQLIKWIERFLLKKKYLGITVAVICTIAAFIFYFPGRYDNQKIQVKDFTILGKKIHIW